MNFDLQESIEILERTPGSLSRLLGNLSVQWTSTTGNENDWQPYDVVGHLIQGERTDWIPRARIILEQRADRTFVSFDRFAQFKNSEGKDLGDLLSEFESLRRSNLEILRSWTLSEAQLGLTGIHPEFGEVTLRQLLSTWVVHDLNHVRQIVTAMARRYDSEVGPWKEYLGILR